MEPKAKEQPHPADNGMQYEVIEAAELAKRWKMPVTWIYDHVRARCEDPIPHKKLGKYVRFEWGSPALVAWWERHSA